METQTRSSSCTCGVNPGYATTPSGILKIVEFVLAVIAFACAVTASDSNYWYSNYNPRAYGWVSFVGIGGFIMAIIYFVFHLLVTTTWTWTAILEVISYGVWTIFFLIAGIVAACFAPGYPTAGAACAFSFFSMAAWAIDTGFQLMNIRITFTSSSGGGVTTTTTSHTTATNSANRFDENPQY